VVDFGGFLSFLTENGRSLAFFVENCSILQKNSGASHHSMVSDLPAITRYVAFLPEASMSIILSRRREAAE